MSDRHFFELGRPMAKRNDSSLNRSRFVGSLCLALLSIPNCAELYCFAFARVRSKRSPQALGVASLMALLLTAACLIGCIAHPGKSLAPSNGNSLQVMNSALPVGTVESSYAVTLTASGGAPPYSWNITDGKLPSGLALNSNTGAIEGTPTAVGAFSFITRVQDSKARAVSTGLSINISSASAPAISVVLPNSGPTEGGTSVMISGQNFQPGATVQFGNLQATSIQVKNSIQIQAVAPAKAAGVVNVTVHNPDAQIATAANAFTFTAPIPSVVAGSATTSWNPAVLGVSWASDFTSIAANQIDVKTDPRLSVKARGDGATDDTTAIRAAIKLASSSGGGVVYFPTGDYKILAPSNSVRATPLVVPSRIVLRGSGSTTARIFVSDPDAASETDSIWTWGGIDFQGASLSGITDLGIYAANYSASPCALLWNRGATDVKELFFNNLDIHLTNCRAFWVEAASGLLVQNSRFDSTESNAPPAQVGPIFFTADANMSFLNNTLTYNFGRAHMNGNSNVLIQDNAFIRDAQNKDMEDGTAIESGGIELSFSSNVQVLDNTIKTLDAPPGEAGDGEGILTQQSTVQDVLDGGSSTAVTSTTLTDTNALWGTITEARLAQYPGEVVAILSGSATGEWRIIQGLDTSTKTITLDQPWNPIPEVGSLYSIFRWTVIHAVIRGNTLIDNPNGINIFDGCYDCVVQDNILTNSRGILLRTVDESLDPSLYPEGRRIHNLTVNNRILNNTVSNTSGVRPAYIALDTEAFAPDSYRGMGMFDVQVGGNIINPYPANPSQTYSKQGEITQDGLFPCFLFGPAPVKDPVTMVFRNITSWNNSQGVGVTYNSNFRPLATSACVSIPTP
jgi:IPT/TIG domain/Pectate lyase superfamily protein/Putative Ig domain